MADISAEIAAFRDAAYGEEVRLSMISLANKLNEGVSYAEAVEDRIEDIEESLSTDHDFVENTDEFSKSLFNSGAYCELYFPESKVDRFAYSYYKFKAGVSYRFVNLNTISGGNIRILPQDSISEYVDLNTSAIGNYIDYTPSADCLVRFFTRTVSGIAKIYITLTNRFGDDARTSSLLNNVTPFMKNYSFMNTLDFNELVENRIYSFTDTVEVINGPKCLDYNPSYFRGFLINYVGGGTTEDGLNVYLRTQIAFFKSDSEPNTQKIFYRHFFATKYGDWTEVKLNNDILKFDVKFSEQKSITLPYKVYAGKRYRIVFNTNVEDGYFSVFSNSNTDTYWLVQPN